LKKFRQINEETGKEIAAHSPETRGSSEITAAQDIHAKKLISMRRFERTFTFISQKNNDN
jgi:hypothetical protein